jgi:hypothetical protein
LVISIGQAAAVAHQPAGSGELAVGIDRRQPMALGERDDLRTAAEEEGGRPG